jgi:hypothetical protein
MEELSLTAVDAKLPVALMGLVPEAVSFGFGRRAHWRTVSESDDDYWGAGGAM